MLAGGLSRPWGWHPTSGMPQTGELTCHDETTPRAPWAALRPATVQLNLFASRRPSATNNGQCRQLRGSERLPPASGMTAKRALGLDEWRKFKCGLLRAEVQRCSRTGRAGRAGRQSLAILCRPRASTVHCFAIGPGQRGAGGLLAGCMLAGCWLLLEALLHSSTRWNGPWGWPAITGSRDSELLVQLID